MSAYDLIEGSPTPYEVLEEFAESDEFPFSDKDGFLAKSADVILEMEKTFCGIVSVYAESAVRLKYHSATQLAATLLTGREIRLNPERVAQAVAESLAAGEASQLEHLSGMVFHEVSHFRYDPAMICNGSLGDVYGREMTYTEHRRANSITDPWIEVCLMEEYPRSEGYLKTMIKWLFEGKSGIDVGRPEDYVFLGHRKFLSKKVKQLYRKAYAEAIGEDKVAEWDAMYERWLQLRDVFPGGEDRAACAAVMREMLDFLAENAPEVEGTCSHGGGGMGSPVGGGGSQGASSSSGSSAGGGQQDGDAGENGEEAGGGGGAAGEEGEDEADGQQGGAGSGQEGGEQDENAEGAGAGGDAGSEEQPEENKPGSGGSDGDDGSGSQAAPKPGPAGSGSQQPQKGSGAPEGGAEPSLDGGGGASQGRQEMPEEMRQEIADAIQQMIDDMDGSGAGQLDDLDLDMDKVKTMPKTRIEVPQPVPSYQSTQQIDHKPIRPNKNPAADRKYEEAYRKIRALVADKRVDMKGTMMGELDMDCVMESAMTGYSQPNVYSRSEMSRASHGDLFIIIGYDCSGSMKGTLHHEAAWRLKKLFTRLRMKCVVIPWSDSAGVVYTDSEVAEQDTFRLPANNDNGTIPETASEIAYEIMKREVRSAHKLWLNMTDGMWLSPDKHAAAMASRLGVLTSLTFLFDGCQPEEAQSQLDRLLDENGGMFDGYTLRSAAGNAGEVAGQAVRIVTELVRSTSMKSRRV